MTESLGPDDSAEQNPLIVIAEALRALKKESATEYGVHNRLLVWMFGISAVLSVIETVALIVVMVVFMPPRIAKETSVNQHNSMTVNSSEDSRDKQVRDVLDGKFVRTPRTVE